MIDAAVTVQIYFSYVTGLRKEPFVPEASPYSIPLVEGRDHGGGVLRHERDQELEHIMDVFILQERKINKQTLNHTTVDVMIHQIPLKMSGCYIMLHLTSSFQDSFGGFNQMAAGMVHYCNFMGLNQSIKAAFRIILVPS